jgi:hypothetical protein
MSFYPFKEPHKNAIEKWLQLLQRVSLVAEVPKEMDLFGADLLLRRYSETVASGVQEISRCGSNMETVDEPGACKAGRARILCP